MSIFGFKKKDEVLTPKTSVVRDLRNSNGEGEFGEIDMQKMRQSKIMDAVPTTSTMSKTEDKIKPIDDTQGSLKEFEESVLLDLGGPVLQDSKSRKTLSDYNIDLEDVNKMSLGSGAKIEDVFNEFKPKKEEKENLEMAKPVDVKISQPPKVSEVKKERTISNIAVLAMPRPPSVAFDLGDDVFVDDGYEVVKFDIWGTDSDLAKLVNSNPDIKYLDISDSKNITDFSVLSKLKKLKHLDISGNKIIKDISFLSGLTQLTVLNIAITGIDTLVNFPFFPNLKVLNLKMNKIKSLKGLEKITSLHDLTLWGSDVDDISILSTFTELRALDFDNCSALKDFSPISRLPYLMFLNLSSIKISDLSFLKNLTNMEVLILDSVSGMLSEVSLANLDGLTKMKFLCIKNMTLRNLSHFKNMKQLTFLDISGNSIVDLSPLEDLVEIDNLILSNNLGLTNLSPLHKMSKMSKLKINGVGKVKNDMGLSTTSMSISDISVIKNMPNLGVFESNNNNKIKDISPIQYCTKLKEAHFKNCMLLSDVTPLRFCKSLEELYLDNDSQIKDISFLKYLTSLTQVSIVSTNIDPLILSNLTNLLSLGVWGFGTGSHPMYNPNAASSKFRKTLLKSIKVSLKDNK